MNCPICKANYENKPVSITLNYQGKWIIVENVPALVCEQCGEQSFEPAVVDKMQHMIWNKKKPNRYIKTPIYDLSEI